MALNWGQSIALFYSFFVCVLIIVVIQSRTFDNSLVTEDYYARDINYQQEYDRRSNSARLGAGPQVRCESGDCRLSFPAKLAERASGNVQIYRPSSKRHDRRLSLRLDEAGAMDLPLNGLPRGYYRVIVEWSAAGTDYYDELDLYH
jgi:hypothetical protein